MFYQEYREALRERKKAKGIKSFLLQRKLEKKREEFLNELPKRYGKEYRGFFEALLYTIEQHPEEGAFYVEFWDIPRKNGSPIQKWVETDPKKRKETLQIMALQRSHYGEKIEFDHHPWWEALIQIW